MTFSKVDKITIKNNLIHHCEISWSLIGYKKTNIEMLCHKSGISKGAFYLFYDSKEELFLDVMIVVQKRLVEMVDRELGAQSTKIDFKNTVKALYREYIKIPFLIETNSSDFITFINKLSAEKLDELESHTNYDIRDIVRKSRLKYKVSEEIGLSALGFIFTPIPEEQRSIPDYLNTIDFMIDTLVGEIFV